jgi:hypothetical protein
MFERAKIFHASDRTATVMDSGVTNVNQILKLISVSSDKTSYIQAKVNRRFGKNISPYVRGQEVIQAIKQHEADNVRCNRNSACNLSDDFNESDDISSNCLIAFR